MIGSLNSKPKLFMNNLEKLEYILVAVIIGLQLFAFVRTLLRIHKYRNLLPDEVSRTDKSIRMEYPGMEEDPYKSRKELVSSLNEYLERNSTGSPDFNLVKDIVERNTGVMEEDISQNVSVPLYLGLMGTMVGIVIGLWSMSSVSGSIDNTTSGDALGAGINVLLGGVKIAMFASFTGIALTVLNSSFLFSTARRKVEKRKNNLYTFIQSSLLPLISKNVNIVMQSLLNNMNEFSKRFEANLGRLEGLMNKNYDTLKAQDNILTSLQEIDINQFVGGNVRVLSELRKSTDKLDRFNDYLDKMAVLLGTSEKLSDSFNGLLGRTVHIEEIAQHLDFQFSMNTELLQFLKTHFSEIKARGALIQNAVIDVDRVLDDSLNQLKAHVEGKLQAIKDMTISEQELLSKSLEGSRDGLSKLGYLELIDSSLREINKGNSMYKEHLLAAINNTTSIVESINTKVHEISAKQNFFERVWAKIKKW
jgi:hypothetical protein